MIEVRRKTVCPFCLLGCELGIIVDGIGIKGVDYLKESKVNQGRLCARGNASALFIDSPDRLAYPVRDGKEITWKVAFKEMIKVLKSKRREEVALTFDCNLTEEEYSLIYELAEKLGIDNLASTYLEPEYYFNYTLPKVQRASLDDVKSSNVFLLVGDVFNQIPVISKNILDARYGDKNSRIFVIDSINSHTAGFADTFIQVKPGGEPLALLAISKIVSNKPEKFSIDEITKAIGVDTATVEEVAQSLNNIHKGVIIAVMAWGKVSDPILFSGASQYLVSVLSGDKKFISLGESLSKPGRVEFGQILDKIKVGEIKTLINFGELFPYYYPQIHSDLRKLQLLVATATLKPDTQEMPTLFLPVALNLEKSGEISTAFGTRRIEQVVEPMSGTKTVKEIIETIAKELDVNLTGKKPKFATKKLTLTTLLGRTKKLLETKPIKREFQLIGEKPAYAFRSFFEKEEVVKINPVDGKKLGVRRGDFINIKSDNGQHKFAVNITGRVPSKVAVVSVESLKARKPFDMKIDKENYMVAFTPTEVKLWKEE